MSCTIKQMKKDSMDSVRAMVKGKASTVSFNRRGDAIITPSPKSAKVKNKDNAVNMALDKIERINAWSKKTFNTDAYKGQWTSLNQSHPNYVTLELTFPKSLEKALYIKKSRDAEQDMKIDAVREAEQLERQEREREGLNEDDLLTDYMMEQMPDTKDGFNYGLYQTKKKEMRDYFAKRVDVLKAMSNKTKATFQQISEFENIVKLLNKDIKHLKEEKDNAYRQESIAENFFNYFDKDIAIVKDILDNHPTMDNLQAARMVINQLQNLISYDEINDPGNPTSFIQGKPSALTGKLGERVKTLMATVNELSTKLLEIELDFVESEGISDPRGAEKIRSIAKWLLPLDGSFGATPIMRYIRKTYDDAVAKAEKYTLRQSLESIKDRIERKLEKNKQKMNIFTRTTDRGFRLAGKFNEQWDAFQTGIARQKLNIESLIYKKDKDAADYKKLKQLRVQLFDSMNKEVEFIDVRSIPEFREHPELAGEFGTFFKSEQEAAMYKEKIIQQLIGKSNNRQLAERIYNNMVEEQLEKLISFQVDMQNLMEKLKKEEGVSNFSQLSDNRKNIYLEKYHTNSPFSFSHGYESTGKSEVGKNYFVEGVEYYTTDVATLDYQSTIPLHPRFTDNDFDSQIASDPDYYEAWEMFETGIKYINRNRKYKGRQNTNDNSIPYELDFFKEKSSGITDILLKATAKTKDRIKNTITTSRYKDIDTQLSSGVMSVDEMIEASINMKAKVLEKLGFPIQAAVTPSKPLTPAARKYLESISDIPVPEGTFLIREHLSNIATREVNSTKQDNLFEILHAQLETVEKFKAKKEIETKLLFFKNMLERVNNNATTKQEKKTTSTKKANAEAVIRFINSNLYGINNRANWSLFQEGTTQSEKAGVQVLLEKDKALHKEIDNNIETLREFAKNTDDIELQQEIANDIEALQELKTGKGRILSHGSVFETLLIKIPIIAGLGFNMTSQLGNIFMGNIAGRQNDGLEWTSGNYAAAASYVRKWKIARRKLSRSQKNRYAVTNILIDGLGIFQNSANEVHKVRETEIKSKILKYLDNPLHIVSDVERTIQRPQILSMMGDIKIFKYDENGQKVLDSNGNPIFVPAFDVNNLSNPHPAFKQVDGVLMLTEEYDTPQNRATWIERTSQEYADLFGESGTVPRMIARINGDYRDSTKMHLKDTSPGAMLAMFKTWLPAFIQRRYGREHGVVTNLHMQGRGGQATMLQIFAGTAFFAIGAGIALSPAVAVLGGAVFGGYKALQASKQKDMSAIQAMWNEIKTIKFNMGLMMSGANLVLSPVRLAAATGAKIAQQSTDLVLGKRVLSDEAISNIAGFKQRKRESDEDFKLNKARLQFLLTEVSTTTTLLLLKILANMLLFPDDEEKEKYNEQDGFYKRLKSDPDTTLYFAVENLLTRFAEDVNLLNDPFGMRKVLDLRSIDNTEGILEAMLMQSTKGNYQSGPNEGKNRIMVKGSEYFLPKGLVDGSLGFGKMSKQDYRPNDIINMQFKSDFARMESRRQELREEAKEKAILYYKEMYEDETEEFHKKEALKEVNEQYPSIKEYFNPDGSVDEAYIDELELYK